MIDFLQILAYPFVKRAIITGSLLVIDCALVGSILLSKRLALLTQSLANVAFLGVALGTLTQLPSILVSLGLVTATSYEVFQRRERTKLLTDSLLALLSNVALALGICLIAYTQGMTLDICNFMFGSVLVIEQGEMFVIIALCLAVIAAYFWLKPYLFAWQLDAEFYLAAKLLPVKLNLAIAMLLSFLLAAGLKIMGTLLLSALLLLPPLTARQLAKTERQAQIYSLFVALLGFYLGLFISYQLYLPSGAAIVTVHALIFALVKLVIVIKQKLATKKVKFNKHLAIFIGLVFFSLNLLSACQKAKQTEALADVFKNAKSPFYTAKGELDFERKLGADKQNSIRTEHLPTGKAEDGSDYLPIYEKQFVLLTNEIYANYKNYLNQTIAYEGVFVSLYDKAKQITRYFVIRYGPGCCAYDGMPGFEVRFPEHFNVSQYKDKDWLYVEGKLQVSHEDNADYLYLMAKKVETGRPEGLINVKH